MLFQRLHHSHLQGKKTAAHYLHMALSKTAVQPGRVAAGSHRSGKSLHDHSSILSTVTRSVPRPTRWLPPHYLTYATAAGESEISFVPSRYYGGKSGGQGFRGPFSSSSSSFARGGRGVNEGKACFSFGVGPVKRCHNAYTEGRGSSLMMNNAMWQHEACTPAASSETKGVQSKPSLHVLLVSSSQCNTDARKLLGQNL
jgi:hypothetical protein